MAKTKTPFLSFGAKGTIGGNLTAQSRGKLTILREKPTPAYRNTLPQQYQRWLYQHYVYLWKQLSISEQRTWHTAASRYHRTGFAHFMSNRLKNLPDIIGGWHLDEPAGSTAIDFSKNGNDGAITGATPVTGTISLARSFDGIDDGINCGNDPSLNLTTDEMTLAAIITPEVMTGGPLTRVALGKYSTNYRFEGHQELNNIDFYVYTDADYRARHSGSWTAGVKHHIVGVYNGTNVIIYVNKVKTVGAATSGPMRDSSALNFWIGQASPGGRPYKAVIDEVTIYNYAWTDEEVAKFQERRFP